jgi:hypothetical protein
VVDVSSCAESTVIYLGVGMMAGELFSINVRMRRDDGQVSH